MHRVLHCKRRTQRARQFLSQGLAAAVLLIASITGHAQIELSLDSLVFNPTTIDSLTTATVTVSNDLSVEQNVTFTGFAAPFTMEANPVVVGPEGEVTATFHFNPVAVNTFTNTVIATGSAFGADTLQIEGEGTLPGAELLADTLDFGAVSVNSVATAYVPVASIGLGSLFISGLTSTSPEIYMDAGVSIAQGDTAMVPIRFFSEFSGVYAIDATLYTTDPFNPTLELHCTISAISEVGGEVCGTWSLVNSPYQLIDDIVVPTSCSLTIEPGVIVLGDEYDIEVFGGFFANGEEGNEVDITCGELLSHTSADQMVLTHSLVKETNEFEFPDVDYRFWRDSNQYSQDSLPFWLDLIGGYEHLFENENSADHIGKYSEDFSDNDGQGWTRDGSYSSSNESGSFYSYYCCSNSWYNQNSYSPVFSLNDGEEFDSVSFDVSVSSTYSNCYTDYRHYYRIDGGSWEELYFADCNVSNNFSIDLSTLGFGASTIQFRFHTYFYHGFSSTIDNFILTTNFYDAVGGMDVPEGFVASLGSFSTGGLELHSSSYQGDFHSVSDSIQINLSNSTIAKNGARAKNSHGLGLYANHVEIAMDNSTIGNHVLEGVHVKANTVQQSITNSSIEGNSANGIEVEGSLSLNSNHFTVQGNGSNGIDVSQTLDWQSDFDLVADNGDNGVTVGSTLTLVADSLEVVGNFSNGIIASGSNSDVTLYQCNLHQNTIGDGIRLSGGNNAMDIDYSFIRDNGGDGIDMGGSNTLELDNSLVGYNGSYGIRTSGSVDINYSDVLHNGSVGISTSQFSTVDNSIVWFNGGVPQMNTSNSFAVSYTNVQGINALLTNSQFAWGDGCIGTDPVLTDDYGHLDPYSPCVDGGMPWEQDAHIPMGLGSSRADMGMYGGPANAYWGGDPPPDGSVIITDVFDIPDDQGGELGIQFSASPFDFGGLGFNVTHYSIWRDLAVDSDSLIDVASGNWEQIGTVPAQGFNQYGYTAETLVNSNPGNPACMTNFIVLAHTTDNNIYWVSDVAGACAIDNLAPSDPDINGLILDENPGEVAVQIHWAAPEEADYAYTEITSDAGFEAQLNNDTLVVDESVEYGEVYTYTVKHFDINGNASNPASFAIEASAGADLIPLVPGWNLVSSDRMPAPAALGTIVASLQPGNLDYVTSFNAGVQFYDPDGLSFLNTLESWTGGYGYWVKVAEADTLELTGSPVPADYLPALNVGWNLVGYPNAAAVSPAIFFEDFIAEGTLEYVTGFNQGSSFYDPDGLPFLNTLNGMYNGLGYWVKVTEAYDPNGMVLAGDEPLAALSGTTTAQPNPNFMLVNGTSDLTDAAGDYVDVVAAGRVVGRLPIFEGGYLMTTALFGDDPATQAIEGLEPGTALEFRFRGASADQIIEYTGNMDLRQLALTFGASTTAVDVFPNPFTESLQIAVELPGEGRIACQLTDATGRVVAERAAEMHAAGSVSLTWNVPGIAPGMYTCQVVLDGKVWSTVPLVRVD